MLLILGGSFDPVHHGHLSIATDLQNIFPTSQIYFLPCKASLKKQLQATPFHRIHMLELAIKEKNAPWKIDTREILRTTPSYTLETLSELRQVYLQHTIVFVLGTDVFSSLDQWDHWQRLIQYTHLLVIKRSEPNHEENQLSHTLKQFISSHQIQELSQLNTQTKGKIAFISPNIPEISSSLIRKKLLKREKPTSAELPETVLDYIQRHRLYCTNSL